MSGTRVDVSVVVPVYNEEAVLAEFYRRLKDALAPLGGHEIVFIDDGSADRTAALLEALQAKDAAVRVI